MNAKVDFYFNKPGKWQAEIKRLRNIVLDCHLTEDLKWGCSCYTYEKKNIVLIHVFKEYCALLFFKGALLKDKKGILIQQTENVQAARQLRFTGLQEIKKLASVIKTYILEAVEVEESGVKVEMKKTREYAVPEEFQKVLDKNKALNKAFYALTPGRQRGYLLHFSSAKQAATRASRVEKNIPRMLEGKGLEDE
jgi:uncharacterized protein YdeI (YjbR/CyaY-like superfamily)